MSTLTPEQTILLLVEAKTRHLSALLVLAVPSGMRRNEMFGPGWGDIDRDAATINVQRSLEEIDGSFRLEEPKSAKGRRRIDVRAFTVDALREYCARVLDEGHIAGPVFWSREARTSSRATSLATCSSRPS